MKALAVFGLLLAIAFVAFLLWYIAASTISSMRKKREALPLHLQYASHKEKRDYFRELREREQKQYDLQYQQDLIDLNNKETRRFP